MSRIRLLAAGAESSPGFRRGERRPVGLRRKVSYSFISYACAVIDVTLVVIIKSVISMMIINITVIIFVSCHHLHHHHYH